MRTIAILCSGQGDQGAGMFDLVADADEAQPVFAAAKSALGGKDARELAASGDADAIHANAAAQILCCTQALASWAVIEGKIDARLIVAGYSVGELAAWGVAGAMSAETVLELVVKRARLMDAASTKPAGLAAVRGLSGTKLDRICRDAGVYVAIRNGPDQVILGGLNANLDRALAAAREAGVEKISPLPIAVPSHTPLLRGAAVAFATMLCGRSDVHDPSARLLSGIDGETVFDAKVGMEKLACQIGQTVNWEACMTSCRAAGAERSLELGPGAALSRMIADQLPERDCRAIGQFRSLDGAVDWLRR